jgi:hypothetical protein
MFVVARACKGADKSAIGPPYRVLKAGQRCHSVSIDMILVDWRQDMIESMLSLKRRTIDRMRFPFRCAEKVPRCE